MEINSKKNLIIISGQDRIGKDYLFDKLEIPGIYKYSSKAKDYPSYRKSPELFEKWVANYLIDQTNDLINLNYKNVMMVRYLYDDIVYSQLFNRKTIAYDLYERIKREYNIFQIIMLFPNYETYQERCVMLGEELEYDEKQFFQVIDGFKSNVNKIPIKSIIYENEVLDPIEVEELIIELIGQ